MTRYAKRKLKYSFSENFNLPPYVEWDRFVTLTGAQAGGLRYRIYHNTSSVSAMLIHLQLPTLEYRRNLNRITMLYKITNNLIAVDPKLYLTPQPSLSTRNNNPLQYQIISTRTNYYKYSFFPHAVVLWNSLPYTVVNDGSLDQFKQLIQGQNI